MCAYENNIILSAEITIPELLTLVLLIFGSIYFKLQIVKKNIKKSSPKPIKTIKIVPSVLIIDNCKSINRLANLFSF